MAILFSDGFDYYNETSGNNNELINISTRYPGVTVNWANYFSYTTGYSGGKSLVYSVSSSSVNSIPIPIGNTLTSVTMGAHVYFPSFGTDIDVFNIRAPNGAYILLSVNSSGRLNTRISATYGSAAQQSSLSITTGSWWYLELHAEVTSGSQILVNVYLNGTLAYTFSGTGFTATPYYWSSFIIGKYQLGYSGSYRMDNFYLSDGEVLGPINISTLVPDGDTAQKDGIPLNGTTNYNMVNDISAPSMDSNVLLKNDLDTDYYSIGDVLLVNANDSIISVQGLSYSTSNDASSTARTSVQLKSASTETTTSIPMLPGVSSPQLAVTGHIRNDPATSLPWTTSGFNSSQLGIRRHEDFLLTSNGFYIDNNGNYPSSVSGSTIIAGDTAPTVSGNALIFNGSQNIRYTDASFWHVTMPYSVQFEFYTTTVANNQLIATVGGNSGGPQWPEWSIFLGNSSQGSFAGLGVYSSSDNFSANQVGGTLLAIANIQTNTWYRVGFMFYSGRLRGYLNDSQVLDIALNGGQIRDSANGFAIGGDHSKDPARQFYGGIRKFTMANQLFWTI